MGLRFRKSITIAPGVKINLGKTGMSVSAGVPGFRKTFHTSGRVTTSVGIPGTGIYYVDTKNARTQSNSRSSGRTYESVSQAQRTPCVVQSSIGSQTSNDVWEAYSTAEIINFSSEQSSFSDHAVVNDCRIREEAQSSESLQLDAVTLKSVHKTSDDTIDWTEVLVSPFAPDDMYNQDMWSYYHSVAGKVLSGDIDTYLELIYEVNPLDDLLAYGGNFEFGTDDPKKIEVEFSINETALLSAKCQMDCYSYNDLLQDYVCSVCIRVARDMFALLPITHTIVHAVLNGETIISIDFDRATLSKVKFGYIDPSDTITKFKCNMEFNQHLGFMPVAQLS